MRGLWSSIGCLAATAFALSSGSTRAAQLAFDNASQSVYADGWQTGDNGGFGFGAWTITPTGQGLIGSSTANGDAQAPAGDIDTPGSRSWALAFVSDSTTITAVRPLTGPLNAGQHIMFDIDGSSTPNSEFMEVHLGSASGDRWYVQIRPTAIAFIGSSQSLVIPPTREGVHVDFTLTGADTYALSANVLGAQPTVVTGTLAGTTGSLIDQVSLQFIELSFVAGDVFYSNSLAVTPEPSGGLLLMCAGATSMARPRRHP
jgi:hypothetical protein